MKKYIVLVPDKTKYTFKYVNSELCDFYNVYKKPNVNILIRLFRKFVYFIGLGIFNTFYEDWTKYLNEDVQFIVFDACRPYHRLKKKLKKAKNQAIIYYWNPVSKKDKIDELKRNFTVFSYSTYDSKNYNLLYNPTFFIDFPLDLNQPAEYDGVFIGRNKGRLIEKVFALLDNPYFYVVKDGVESSEVLSLKTNNIEYSDYLQVLARSKSVIEILYADNADYTLRTMEALFYQRKLITNNRLIVTAEFYNKNNIYVLDEKTNKYDILNFLSLPFVPYSQEQINYYSIEKWLLRFNHD